MPAADGIQSFSDMASSPTSSPLAAHAPAWDFSRTAAGARMLVAVGRAHDLPDSAILVGTGLTAADLEDPSTEVEAGQELAIARNLVTHLGDIPGLGVEAGRRYTICSLGIWGFALMTSPTVRDLVQLGTRYAALSFAFIRPIYEETPSGAVVVFEDEQIPQDVRALFVERELTKMLNLFQVVVGAIPGFWMETSFTGARAAALRAASLGADVRIGQPRHLLGMSTPLLDAPLPQADPATARDMEAQCEALVQRRSHRRGVAAHVRARLLVRLADPMDMDEIAAEMHVDVRTLRRKLAEEHTSYRELVDEIRTAVAIELLHEGQLTVHAVATRLGYHDAAGFARAFKRWTGTAPGSHRAATAANP